MIKENLKSQVQLISIDLLKSNFDRGKVIDNPTDLKMHIELGDNINDSEILVDVRIKLTSQEFKGFILDVVMVGTFVKEGELPFPMEEFYEINAPAIIYPYIRQHIRALSLDAGLKQAIILPTINFVLMYNEKKAQEDKKQEGD